MRSEKTILFVLMGLAVFIFLDLGVYARSYGRSNIFKEDIYEPGSLKPKDSTLKVKVGDRAPDFSLPAISGGKVSLSQYLSKMNVVLFICSCGMDARLLRSVARLQHCEAHF